MLFPLDMMKAGEMAEIAVVSGDSAWVSRMAEMGVREGCKLEMLQSGSTCLLKISNCKLCIRHCDDSQILVRPVSA